MPDRQRCLSKPLRYRLAYYGRAGVSGSAPAVAKLLNLNEQQMVWALGLAASQPVGLRESFGSMNKSFNPGRAANNGTFASVLASNNFTSSDEMIEAKRGWANTVSTKQDYREILGGPGVGYEALLNTYKPFACGIVMHPAIDADIQLRNENQLASDPIARVELKVNPLVLELTGRSSPRDGLGRKFSIYHAVAIALVEGAGDEKQFSDRAVGDATAVALRGKVIPVVTPGIEPGQVDMTITLKEGRQPFFRPPRRRPDVGVKAVLALSFGRAKEFLLVEGVRQRLRAGGREVRRLEDPARAPQAEEGAGEVRRPAAQRRGRQDSG
jgi:2-methylcitrate dehydratase PrpD